MLLWVFFCRNVCFFVAPTSVQDPELRLAPVQDPRLKLATLALIFVRSRPRTIRGFRAIFHMRRLGSLSGPGQALVRISWVPGFPVWGLGPCLSLARLLVRDRYYFTRGSQRKRFCAGLGLSLGLARPCSEAFPPRFNLVSSRRAFLDFHSGAQHPGFGESGN